jgi:hypothetical protein
MTILQTALPVSVSQGLARSTRAGSVPRALPLKFAIEFAL